MALLRSAVRYFIPERLGTAGSEDVRRAELTLFALMVVAALTGMRSVLFLSVGPKLQGAVAGTASLGAVGAMFLLRLGALATAANLLSALLFAAVTFLTYERGGLDAPPLLAFAFVPLIAVLCAGWRSGLFWALACAVALSVFALIGEALVDQFPPSRRRPLHLIGGLSAIVLSLGLASAYEATKNAALRARDEAEQRRQRLADEQRRLQVELMRAESEARIARAGRLAALGELAAGLAHDFNNLLMVVGGHAELAGAEIEHNPEAARHALSEIRTAIEHASELTRQLLAFGRRQPGERKPVSIAKLVDAASHLLRGALRSNVTLAIENGTTQAVLADAAQLEQVLLNLCVNARDAMPDGGRLTITTTAVVIDESLQQRLGLPLGRRFGRLQVMDTGTGMTEAVIERLFEPFFTTKENERGSGLGLSVAYAIVRDHDGVIDVSSRPGRGSTFTVYLPTADDAGTGSIDAQPSTSV